MSKETQTSFFNQCIERGKKNTAGRIACDSVYYQLYQKGFKTIHYMQYSESVLDRFMEERGVDVLLERDSQYGHSKKLCFEEKLISAKTKIFHTHFVIEYKKKSDQGKRHELGTGWGVNPDALTDWILYTFPNGDLYMIDFKLLRQYLTSNWETVWDENTYWESLEFSYGQRVKGNDCIAISINKAMQDFVLDGKQIFYKWENKYIENYKQAEENQL